QQAARRELHLIDGRALRQPPHDPGPPAVELRRCPLGSVTTTPLITGPFTPLPIRPLSASGPFSGVRSCAVPVGVLALHLGPGLAYDGVRHPVHRLREPLVERAGGP